MTGATLDAGALIGFERGDRTVIAIIVRALQHEDRLTVPAGVVGQAWRDGRRQSRLARLLGSAVCEIVPLDDRMARAAGQLCGVTGTADVVDASVVLCARTRSQSIVTGDAADLSRLDPAVTLISV